MERDLIAEIARRAAAAVPDPSVISGIGDDCAVVAPTPGSRLVITTDTMVEAVHFDLEYFDPRHLGGKLASVNLSDIGSMGARPRWALLNIAARPGLSRAFWDRFIHGLVSRLGDFSVRLVGGDTVSAPEKLSLTMTIIGECEPGRLLSRGSARPGEFIYCSGFLGEAAVGMELLERTRPPGPRHRTSFRRLLERHLDPVPRVFLGMALLRSGLVRTCIDISDGLATDLAHVCESSGTGAVIFSNALPVSRCLKNACRLLGLSPARLALTGGEDFELLWTVSSEHEKKMLRLVSGILGAPPFRLGKIVAGEKVWLKSTAGLADISYQGYEHAV